MGVRGRVWACVGVRGRAWACVGVRGRAWACVGVRGRAWGCMGLPVNIGVTIVVILDDAQSCIEAPGDFVHKLPSKLLYTRHSMPSAPKYPQPHE